MKTQNPIFMQKAAWQTEKAYVSSTLNGMDEQFRVRHRILDDAGSIDSATYLQSLITRLKKGQPEIFGQKNITVILSDNASFASIIPSDDKHIIIFDQSFLRKLKTEDQIASILAHEMAHTLFKEEITEYTTAEEISADLISAELLSNAGYRWEEGAVALKTVLAEKTRNPRLHQVSSSLLWNWAADDNATQEARHAKYRELKERHSRLITIIDNAEDSAQQIHATLEQRIKYSEQTLPGAYLITRGEALKTADEPTATPRDLSSLSTRFYKNPYITQHTRNDPIYAYEKYLTLLKDVSGSDHPFLHAEACEYYFNELVLSIINNTDLSTHDMLSVMDFDTLINETENLATTHPSNAYIRLYTGTVLLESLGNSYNGTPTLFSIIFNTNDKNLNIFDDLRQAYYETFESPYRYSEANKSIIGTEDDLAMQDSPTSDKC